MMASGARPPAGPADGSAWLSSRPGQPRPWDAGTFTLATLPTSPFWARRYAHSFLGCCRGISREAMQAAELVVSELVTNAVRFSSDPDRTRSYSGRVTVGLISLSLRHFNGMLLIEVYDTDRNPPVLDDADMDAEGGRGLMLVDALAKEWSYFFPPYDGKVVYCLLETS